MSSRIQFSNGIEMSGNNKKSMSRRLSAYAGKYRSMTHRRKGTRGMRQGVSEEVREF